MPVISQRYKQMGKRPKQLGNLAFAQKKRICEWHDEDFTLTQKQLAAKAQRELCLLNAPTQGTISNILKARERFIRAKTADLECKRARVVAFPAVDEALANWVLHCQSRRVSLNGDMIRSFFSTA